MTICLCGGYFMPGYQIYGVRRDKNLKSGQEIMLKWR